MTARHGRFDIERSAASLLRPVLKLLIGRGLSRQTLDELVDVSYIEVATQRLGAGATDTSLEAISEKSGVPTGRVRALMDVVEKGHKVHAASLGAHAPLIAAAERVMTAWHTDSRFTDRTGQPLPYSVDEPGFTALVQQFGNKHTPAAIADLLLATQSVTRNDAGELAPKGRHVLAPPQSPEMAFNALEALTDLANTVAINFEKQLSGAGAMQRTCVNERMPRRVAPVFRAMVREATQAFLESIDDWLAQYEATDDHADDQAMVRLGVGVYIVAEE